MSKSFSDSTDWKKLLGFIKERSLVPIIGREMYKFSQDDILLPIDSYLSQQILDSFNISDQSFNSLAAAFNFLVTAGNKTSVDFTDNLKTIVSNFKSELPIINQLLQVSDFSYFINTEIYNNLLETKLEQLRNQKPETRNFSIEKPLKDYEEPEEDDKKVPFVLNVFGSLLKSTDPAFSDDAIVEFTGYFKERLGNAANIFSALKTKNLLFLGCDFPEGISRFVLRQITSQPLAEWGSRRMIYIVNDSPNSGLLNQPFLNNYNAVTFGGNNQLFVHQLLQKWKEITPEAQDALKTGNIQPADKNSKTQVFLSYAFENRDSVQKLKTALESNFQVQCWFDKNEINLGARFVDVISDGIESSDFVIACISAQSLDPARFVTGEWIQAYNKQRRIQLKYNDNNKTIFLPVVIDGTDDHNIANDYLKGLSTVKILNGEPSQDQLTILGKYLTHPLTQ